MGFRFDIDSITPASSSGGGSSQIESLNVTPTTSTQTITAPSGVDGYSPVNVSAVTASIDNNIVASNIVSGVSILGVNGSATVLNGETINITPTTSQQIITPTSPKNGITQATVAAVTSSIDSNIIAENIKKDVPILGVIGTLESGGSGANILREVTAQGVAQFPTQSFTFSLPSNVTDVGNYVYYQAFGTSTFNPVSSSGLTYVDLSSLRKISGNDAFSNAFAHCTNLIDFKLNNLIEISGNEALIQACNQCTSLYRGNVSVSGTVSGTDALRVLFFKCTGIETGSISIGTLSGSGALNYTYSGCTALKNVTLTIDNITVGSALSGIFYNCANLNDIYCYFNNISNTDALVGMMNNTGSTKTHTIHFDSSMRSTIESLTGYPTFGGTSGYVTIAYDL